MTKEFNIQETQHIKYMQKKDLHLTDTNCSKKLRKYINSLDDKQNLVVKLKIKTTRVYVVDAAKLTRENIHKVCNVNVEFELAEDTKHLMKHNEDAHYDRGSVKDILDAMEDSALVKVTTAIDTRGLVILDIEEVTEGVWDKL